MKQKRSFHKEKIHAHHQVLETRQQDLETSVNNNEPSTLQDSNIEEISDTFKKIVMPKKRKMDVLYKNNKKQKLKDENYIPYAPTDRHTEEG